MNARALMRDSLVHSAAPDARRRAPAPGHGGQRERPRRCAIRGTRAPSSRAPPARSVGSSHRQPSRCHRSCAIAGSAGGSTCSISRSTISSRAAKVTEGSLNDVFVAAVIGGLHRYHERHGDCPDSPADDAADQPPPRGRRLRRQSLRARALRRAGHDHRSTRARAGDPHARAPMAGRAGAAADRAARRCARTGCRPRPPPRCSAAC